MGPISAEVNFPLQGEPVLVPVSFPIPLAAPLEVCEFNFETEEFVGQCQIHIILENGKELNAAFEEVEESPFCPGSVEEPLAEPGNLCFYTGKEEHTRIYTLSPNNGSFLNPATGEQGASTAGLELEVLRNSEHPAVEHIQAFGTWAVTAE
jgi:hypothetical protein